MAATDSASTMEGTRFAGSPPVVGLLVFAVVMGLLLGRFALAGNDAHTAPTRAPSRSVAHDSSAQVASLQAQLRARPDEPSLLTQLGVAYLARARETADPTYYAKAAEA